MEKYVVYTCQFEIDGNHKNQSKYLKKDIFSAWSAHEIMTELCGENIDGNIRVAAFDSKDAASACLAKQTVYTQRTGLNANGTCLRGQVAYLAEESWDEDGEFIEGGDIWEEKAEAIKSEYSPDFAVRDHVAGNVIVRGLTQGEAESIMKTYEEDDRKEGIYTSESYEVYDMNNYEVVAVSGEL